MTTITNINMMQSLLLIVRFIGTSIPRRCHLHLKQIITLYRWLIVTASHVHAHALYAQYSVCVYSYRLTLQWLYTCLHRHTRTYTQTHTHIHTDTYSTHVHSRAYTHAYTQTQTQTQTHTESGILGYSRILSNEEAFMIRLYGTQQGSIPPNSCLISYS